MTGHVENLQVATRAGIPQTLEFGRPPEKPPFVRR
jgi:hypothetical protein